MLYYFTYKFQIVYVEPKGFTVLMFKIVLLIILLLVALEISRINASVLYHIVFIIEESISPFKNLISQTIFDIFFFIDIIFFNNLFFNTN